MLGIASLPLIAIPHPLAGNDDHLVRAKAVGIAEQVRSALTLPVSELQAYYREHFLTLTDKRLSSGAICVDEVCSIDPAIAEQRH